MRSVRFLLLLFVSVLGWGSTARGQTGPVPGIPFIEGATVVQDAFGFVTIEMVGFFPDVPGDSCWSARPFSESPTTLLIEPASCDSARRFWVWRFGVGVLVPGYHTILIRVVQETGGEPTVYQGLFTFSIPPQSTKLPYVDDIWFQAADSLPSPYPICPTDSIRVTLFGNFPNPCFSLQKIELVRTPTPADVPVPPRIVLTVERGGCKDGPCPAVLEPWSASIVLPPLPAGPQVQLFQMIEVDCALPDSIVARHSASVPFLVEECNPPVACLWPDFLHPNGFGDCDAFVAPERPAKVTLALRTTADLAGLQGNFVLDPAKLRIVAIQPIGVAQGMHLNWVPTETGARFTMFAESGAPILGCRGDIFDERCPSQPIVEVTIAALDPSDIPVQTWVYATELLGSDVFGNGVRICPVRDPAFRLAFRGAKVCTGPSCDFNVDGRTDVRDLVLMVHCVNDPTTCTNSAFDCNRDSTLALEDVICCAIHMLREGSICPECPPDTTRPAPHVRGVMGAPVIAESSIEIPVTLIGAEALGGAVLEFDYPADRYDVDVSLNNGSGIWLELDQLRSGKLAVGLVRTSPIVTLDVDQRLDLTMRLTLKPGQTAGGDFAYARGEFSGMDGTLLEVDLGSLSQTLGTGAQLQLSEPRPNPTAGETRFSVTLDRESEVEIGVYDLNGRRVATVHRGTLTAGPHEFTWQGRNDQGSAVPNGIYFYRATGYGNSVTRKLVMLRGR